ncbi:hypothetical protein HG536_0B06800 [Torulaspora globosa]|uniref:Major facilitator superfamily (MFS) profile domain-containing protein n=1 Tax=Torulaspora globosa TaxID=48254 RepID=A0A7G3ZE76_9SACH|nr:uncharacterized protein HG536_0B06800 [Torulaspora globosa]QLL31812.1 hypothetical protein HG536_0B06800 [Torulaspora globosa]
MFGPTYSVTKITCIVAICGFIMGMDVTSSSVFLGKDHFIEYFNHPSPIYQGLLTAASPLGGLCGCILFNCLAGKLGRVDLFRAGLALWVKGSFIGLFSLNLWLVILSRWVKGLTVGMFSILIAAYVAEVIPKHKKGRTMALVQLAFSLAMLTIYYLCVLLDSLGSPLSFRVVWGLEMTPAVTVLALTMWLPESPEWLTLHGDYMRAEEIQNRLAAHHNKSSDGTKVSLYSKLELACIYGSKADGFGYLDLFRKNCWRQTLMGSTLQLLIQFSGINIVMYYIIFLCDMIGLQGTVRLVSASMPYLINVPLNILPIIISDHVKRKDLTLAGAFPLSIIMLILGTTMACNGKRVPPINGNKSLIWAIDESVGSLVLGLSFLFVAVFTITLSSGPWIYTNELLPTKAKHRGLAVCMLVGWTANFSLTLLGPVMLATISWGTFILLGTATFTISMAILLFFPDTKDLTPEEIDHLYDKSSQDVAASSSCKEDLENNSPDSSCVAQAEAGSEAIKMLNEDKAVVQPE